MIRKFLHDLLTLHKECKGEMHYEIEFPEATRDDEQICQFLLDDFERRVKSLAEEMGLTLHEI